VNAKINREGTVGAIPQNQLRYDPTPVERLLQESTFILLQPSYEGVVRATIAPQGLYFLGESYLFWFMKESYALWAVHHSGECGRGK
jgi:hypothetical protein